MKPLFTAVIAGVHYLLHPDVLGTIQEDIDPDAVLPVTLVTTEELQDPNLDDLLKGFEGYDDVFSSEFSFALVEKPGANATKRDINARGYAPGKQTYSIEVTQSRQGGGDEPPSTFSNLPTGPYILHGKDLHQAYRIYDDELGAFSTGIVPSKHDSFDQFIDLGETLGNETHRPIAVPSRLYFPHPSIKKPLSGLRFSIPEDFAVAGLPTTLSSNNWTSLYPDAASKHADYVQLLIGQGAIIVGRTKDGQFGAGADWVDVKAPTNPRGDGKQPAGGAAAGADSAVANYTWLENSISQGAIDGSLPQAAAYALFSLRTTPGTASQNGVRASSSKFQSTGISSRSLEDVVHLIAPAFKLPWKATALPQRLVYPVDFEAFLSEKQKSLMGDFIAALEKLLKVKAEKISIAAIWAKNPPREAKKDTLDQYLGNSTYDAFYYDFYHTFDEFRSAYKKKFGEVPYSEPSVSKHWTIGSGVDIKSATKKLEIFTSWFNKNVAPTAANSANKAAIVIPVLSANSEETAGLRPEILSPILGTPQMSTPFAQIAMSDNKDAYLPFSAGIIGAKGDDLMLVQTMKRAFDLADWRIHVDTGRLTYPVGTNDRAVDDHHQDPFPPTTGPGAFMLVEDPDDMEL